MVIDSERMLDTREKAIEYFCSIGGGEVPIHEVEESVEQCDSCKMWGVSAADGGSIVSLNQSFVDQFGYDRVCKECEDLL